MTNIISGFETQGGDWDGSAIMRGFEQGAKYRQAQNESKRQDAALALAASRAKNASDRERREEKRRADVMADRERAMGEIGELRESAQRGGGPVGPMGPELGFEDSVSLARKNLKDPATIAAFDASVDDLRGIVKAKEERASFDKYLSGAELDNSSLAEGEVPWITPKELNEFRARADSGERLGVLSGEIEKRRRGAASAKIYRDENSQALERAWAILDSFPDGRSKSEAKILLEELASSRSRMSEQDAGVKAVAEASRLLLGPEPKNYGDKYPKNPFADPGERAEAIAWFEEQDLPVTEVGIRQRIGVKYGQGAPKTPQEEQLGRTRREHTQVPAVVDAKVGAAVDAALGGGAKSHGDILAMMKQAGIPITAENIEAAKAQIQSWRYMRASAGGVERGGG